MEELKNIIKELKSYNTSLGVKFSDDMILDCATRIFNSGRIKEETKEERATEKQINLLNKLKYKGDTSILTKKEASQLIDGGMRK